ncbi:ATP-dependent DNA helicase [Bifidobacterium samirii]|uniref:DNA 3'-5' helicase n=1 Tax=Bifidobacterium samirii TaxID=2306974 RepID=A0A430FVZ2_9BIFI|nr:ATP-dependent DNA helicase [Bifidobacterium samirii]RSX58102.1 UvrD/REP helicase [Bifidobacterium samirii]
MSEQTGGRPAFTDSPEQARVIGAPADDDVLVVAGAGSGKTYTMTRRIIALIERGVSPERILGLTFTRKAASELLARVSAAVTADGTIDARRAFLKPEVSTYDAFFQTIVRQYGLLVGFDQNTQPLSDAGARQLASVVVGRHPDLLLAHELGSFDTVVGSVLDLSHAIGNAMIGGGVDSVDTAIARIRRWDTDFIRCLDTAIGDEPVPDEEPKRNKPRKSKKDTDADREAKRAQYRDQLHAYTVWRCAGLRDVTRRRDALLDLVADYELEKRRQNMAEFSDFTVAAYQLVTRFPSIGARYRRRYTHVLLDEYQDTSTTQAMLLAALFHPGEDPARVVTDGDGDVAVARTAGDAVGEASASTSASASGELGWDIASLRRMAANGRRPHVATRDGNRSAVNAVGDPFQSIYAFRGASPGAFRMFQRDFGMGETARPFPLSVTRRNSRIVLEAANNLTQPLRVPPRRAGSSLMREVDVAELSHMDTAPQGTLGVLGLTTLGQEIDAVARFAKRAIALHTPGASADGTAATDARPHVAVLFRSKIAMPAFARGLERAGLTTLVVGRSALLERPEIKDLLALLRAVVDHTDPEPLLRLLATPRYGLGSEELRRLSRLTERADAEGRLRALIEAGIVDPSAIPGASGAAAASDPSAAGLSSEAVDAIVREYRDRVPHSVFLADLLMRDDLPDLLGRADGFAPETVRATLLAAGALRQVQAVANRGLREVVDEAVRALNLDIDLIVAQAVTAPERDVNPSQAMSGIASFAALVDTYAREIVEGTTPTLHGFVDWVESLRDVEDTAATPPDTPVDVVLMTIHQSKGLEWDAVAVAGMTAGTFPSNKGGLRIDADPDHEGTMRDGHWIPPEYHVSVRTWLDDASAVPAPVRVDAGILPRFPHDAAPGADPADALAMLDDVEVIDDEIYGDMRGEDIGDDMDQTDADGWYLTQGEEYGRRLLADERRLAYVALTRARHDALLTYSRYGSESTDPRTLGADGTKPKESKPSVFWSEVCDSMCHHDGIVSAVAIAEAESAREEAERSAEPSSERSEKRSVEQSASGCPDTLASIGAPAPEGYFVGEHAAAYAETVVADAWRAPLASEGGDSSLPWPASLSEATMARLRGNVDADDSVGAGGNDDADADMPGGPGAAPDADSLLGRAMMLVSDPDLMPAGSMTAAGIDERVRERATRLLAAGRQNVTSLQARAGHLSERESRAVWRGVVRPIPHVASPSAQAGTLLHAWAERFVNASDDGMPDVTAAGAVAASDTTATPLASGTPGESRESLIADLDARERDPDADAKERDLRDLTVWKRRLVESRWARRRPAWAERQIVAELPGVGIVNGKLDAVFHGGLDPDDPAKRYTIVDWKTGRRPRRADEIDARLVQLDWYRLLLAYIENVELDSIDATLYYLSESDEGKRELHARAKSEAEILAELNDGIPEQSDDD